MARRIRPVPGDGRGVHLTRAYSAFAADLLSGAVKATVLHEVTEPDGFVTVTVKEFVEDPSGTERSEREDGTFVRGRFDDVRLQVPRVRLVGMQYTDPTVPVVDERIR